MAPAPALQAAAMLLIADIWFISANQSQISQPNAGQQQRHSGVLDLPPPPAVDDNLATSTDQHGSGPTMPQQWRNVLDARNTWFFDLGSNFGWSLKETAGQKHAFVGPAPDWSLGNRAVPTLEFDVIAQAVNAGDELGDPAGGNFAAIPYIVLCHEDTVDVVF